MKNKEEPQPVAEPVKQPEPDFLGQYRTCYPHTRTFYVTGDSLVFPDNPKAAEAHQQSIGKGKLETY